MSKLFTIAFHFREIEQLLMLLHVQTTVADQNAIHLSNKIKVQIQISQDQTLVHERSSVDATKGTGSIHAYPLTDQKKISLPATEYRAVHSITFEPTELDKLINILYLQTSMPDEQAISLIAKINGSVHKGSVLKEFKQNLLSNENLDLALVSATETYYQYRHKRLLSTLSKEENYKISTPVDPLVKITKTLEQIAQTLETIVPHLPAQRLGFTNHYRQEIIYCEAKQGSYWHLRHEQTPPLAIHGQALTCIPQALNIVTAESAEPKLHLHVQADKFYCLEIPNKGLFTAQILRSIAQLSPAQLQQPITIEPLELPDSQELTCQIYYQGAPITDMPGIPPPLSHLIQQVQIKLQQASTGHF
ncbi:MAG: hypothetical protein ACO3NK_04890 [Prochlorotrichaceae cyanobacterium]|jgi:hypothetical protein